ncbi:exocyst complex component Sec10 [Capsaspora owczarzaki ATCC 30864]|uniref:Exocyst complex component Sec10 n=1 Tax=Capsaspora owczarzaki (strain ATCC 30864) TaxID=595528 RepID=A0A0D2WJ12_CAPO3|nr:exocyst complex component Sec10 [Capsaspora owczarzaki ATCC 30864]KJE89173.1 exocyst complex component Sec10 [Capsaspora owczarzaki ATCC 30864]|eukprot:XP_004365569.1 exocyst complex component Sec10 [Capsaspora owczarzaki ATCC 30864]
MKFGNNDPFVARDFVEQLAKKALNKQRGAKAAATGARGSPATTAPGSASTTSTTSTTSTATDGKAAGAGAGAGAGASALAKLRKDKDKERASRADHASDGHASVTGVSTSSALSAGRDREREKEAAALAELGGNANSVGDFDPQPLLQLFKDGISTLGALGTWVEDKITRMESSCQEAERRYRAETAKLNQGYQIVVTGFFDLDDRIQNIAAKAVHLGNRLETANVKRTRAQEAQELMNIFSALDLPGQISTLPQHKGRGTRRQLDTGKGAVSTTELNSDDSGDENDTKKADQGAAQAAADTAAAAAMAAAAAASAEGDDAAPTGAALGLFAGMPHLNDDAANIRQWHARITAMFFAETTNIHQAAALVQKLDFLAQELSLSDRFGLAKERIALTYSSIEAKLHERFAQARGSGDVEEMKQLANTLYSFRNYNLCVETFINLHRFFKGTGADFTTAKGVMLSDVEIFDDMVTECIKEGELIQTVFRNPESIMAKFVARIFEQRLSSLVETELKAAITKDYTNYLARLYRLFQLTQEMVRKLTAANFGADLPTLVDSVFQSYLSDYVRFEELALEIKYTSLLQQFYESIHHNRRDAASTKGLLEKAREFKDKLQAGAQLIGDLTINNPFINSIATTLSPSSSNADTNPFGSSAASASASASTPSDNLLSIELALTLIHLNADALQRCHLLSTNIDIYNNAQAIFAKLLDALCVNHVGYALDVALAGLPAAEPRTEPNIQFVNVVHAANYVFHLLQGHFRNVILPVVSQSYPAHSACVNEKNRVMETLESKISTGLERVLDCVSFWFERILDRDQQRTDFRPDDNDVSVFNKPSTVACQHAVQYMARQRDLIVNALDGRNLEIISTELGTRCHTVLLDHLKKFTVNSLGGLVLTRDIAEYQSCMRKFNLPALIELFETLRELSAIFVVKPENLRQVCSEGLLAHVDRETIMAYVRQRADYKSAGVARFF